MRDQDDTVIDPTPLSLEQLPRIAARIGVQPLAAGEKARSGVVVAMPKDDGREYDLLALIEGVLDYVDERTANLEDDRG